MNAQITIEIHDVTPAAREEVNVIHESLAKIGVERPTLLVVPAFEDQNGHVWDLRDDPRTVDWLQNEQRRGAELVLHGLSHRAPGAPPPGWTNWMMHHWFSRGCAEFAHLELDEASARLSRGKQIFSDCALSSNGFIAPAWQQSAGAIAAVERAGFSFTAFFRSIVALQGSKNEIDTPVLTFAAPGPWSDRGKRLYMRAVEAASKRRSLLRVAFHPEDVHGPLDHAIARLRALLERRTPTSYDQICQSSPLFSVHENQTDRSEHPSR